jgi:hypothetical protein
LLVGLFVVGHLAVGCGRIGYDELALSSLFTGGHAAVTAVIEGGSGGASNRGDASSDSGTGGGLGSGGASGSGNRDAGRGGTQGTGGLTVASGGGGGAEASADSGCGTTGCDPWWDSNFKRRRKLTFDQRQQPGSVESLSVLVLLDATRIDYGATQSLGQDVRFVDDDGRTVLRHEVERWTAGATSVVWVRVPSIEPRTDLDHVWMYYGNPSAPDVQEPGGVWGGYDAVYHLDGLADSTGKQAAAADHGTTVVTDGIGHARGFDGVAAYLDLGANLSMLQAASMMTVSLRVRVRSIVGERALLSSSVNSATPTGLSRAFVSFVNAADLRAGGRARDVDATSTFLTTLNAPMSVGANTWQHIAAVMDLTSQEILLFVDGALQQTDALSIPFSAPMTDATPTSFNVLGASDDLTSQYLDGTLDEVRIAPVRRTPAWVDTDARSERDGLIRFGPEQIL